MTAFTQIEAADFDTVRNAAEAIIFEWARVSDVEAPKLAVLEALFGEQYTVGRGTATNDPNTARRGQQLENSWDILFEGLPNNLLVQSNFAGAFVRVGYDIVTDAPQLIGSIEDVVAGLADGTPNDPFQAIKHWGLLAPLVKTLGAQTDLCTHEVDKLVNEALEEAGLPFTLDTLANAKIWSGIEGAPFSGRSQDDLFVGSEASETFFASFGSDIYLIGTANAGNDEIREYSSFFGDDDEDVSVLPDGVTADGLGFERTYNGFILTILSTDARISVEDCGIIGDPSAFGIELVRFSGGSEWRMPDLVARFENQIRQDFDGNGFEDILWRKTVDGTVGFWAA